MHLTIRRFSGLAILLVGLLLASPAAADTPADEQTQQQTAADDKADDAAFDRMLRGIDTLPDRQALEERWPDAKQRLIATATDTDASDYKRWRATGFLTEFDGPEIRKALVELLDDAQPYVRAQAYYVLGATVLEAGDDELFDRVIEGLDDEADLVRRRVVLSLGHTDHERAPKLLQEIVETDDNLGDYAERSLERNK